MIISFRKPSQALIMSRRLQWPSSLCCHDLIPPVPLHPLSSPLSPPALFILAVYFTYFCLLHLPQCSVSGPKPVRLLALWTQKRNLLALFCTSLFLCVSRLKQESVTLLPLMGSELTGNPSFSMCSFFYPKVSSLPF